MSISPLVVIAIFLSLAMAGAWLVQRATGKSGWIDTVWSASVGIGGILAIACANGDFNRRAILSIIIILWALRLGSHIGLRTKGSGEDPRYAELIAEWGTSAALRLFIFLQLQSLAAFVLVLAVYVAATNDQPFPSTTDSVAVLLAIVALSGEALSDVQLSRFRKRPEAKTEVCEIGFWRYSRHPNYFFEWLFWCCWPLFASTTSSLTALTLSAPLMMYWLLVHVSGVPPLEEHMMRSRGEKYRALQRRVNTFFPGPRKSNFQGDR